MEVDIDCQGSDSDFHGSEPLHVEYLVDFDFHGSLLQLSNNVVGYTPKILPPEKISVMAVEPRISQTEWSRPTPLDTVLGCQEPLLRLFALNVVAVPLTCAGDQYALPRASRKGNTIDLHDTKMPLANIYCITFDSWAVRGLYDALILSHHFSTCTRKNIYKHRKPTRSRNNHSPMGCVGVFAVSINNIEHLKMNLEYLNMHIQISICMLRWGVLALTLTPHPHLNIINNPNVNTWGKIAQHVHPHPINHPRMS